MGQKDISEKILVDYNDVFADILNVCRYEGEEVVKPEELENTSVHAQYKAEDDKLHEEEVLNDEISRLEDPEYLAKYAREKYLYSKKDEIIIKIEE